MLIDWTLKKRLGLFAYGNLVVVILVVLTLVYSWLKIEKALERQDYALKVQNMSFSLQRTILKEDVAHLEGAMKWETNLVSLTKILNQPPELTPAQQTLQNSLITQNKSLDILYRKLMGIASKTIGGKIENLLTKRLLVQVDMIVTDSQHLAALARNDIKKIEKRQILIILITLLCGVLILFVGAHRIGFLVSEAVYNLKQGIDSINKRQFKQLPSIHGFEELSRFIAQFNQMSSQLEKTTVTRDVLQQIVEERTAVLKQIANTDHLTQIANRVALFERGNMEFARAKKYNHSLTLLLIDCDWFKKINENYGHSIGDNLLFQLARICERQLKDEDFLARYNGAEFAILLPHSDITGGLDIAYAIKDAISENALYKEEEKIEFSVSIGLAALMKKHDSFENMLADAEAALTSAKDKGKNCIDVTSP
ncbi:GGDEF domain-containing protein [Aliikangiella sp. G2MR2-5]|uniref:GGDEF domain-containing protein n=1 Tax=Aliikangiella sp. G2MR2-5 TaxID=2788943 RepID=UPI001AEEAA65|nr:GGDEF domain-containing protein [Aliikangiella sp. G2MR2-5]